MRGVSKRNFFRLLLIALIFLFKPIESDNLINNNGECRSVLIGDNIIFIKRNARDYSINYYDFTKQNTTSIGSYSNNINNFKNILKINDTSFFIYGFNEGTTLYLNFFSIKNGINSLQNEGIKSTNLELTSLDTEPDIKIIAEKLIISIISETKFITASYDISTNQLLKIEIPHSSELASFTVTKVSIRCSSLNGDNFFCVYHYYNPSSSQRQNPMFYAYGNYNNNNDIKIRNICSKCIFGNIEAIDANKYLLCYHDPQSNSYFTVRCKYYTYISSTNNLEEDTDENTFFIPNYNALDHKPITIYKSENSILIVFNYPTEDVEITYVIIASLSFKIKSEFKMFTFLPNSDLSTINIFTNENYLYHIYALDREEDPKTYINRTKIIGCSQISGKDTVSVTKNSVQYNLLEGHDRLKIKFAINESLHLSPSNQIYDPSINEKTNFIIQRGNDAGVFHNYYMYLNDSNFFSLICPLTITSCHNLCAECTPNLEASDSENHCKNCISGYYPKYDDIKDDEGGSNCYKQDEIIQNYYYDSSSNKFMSCNETCKYCENSYSCLSCKEGYYFKSEEVMNNICHTGQFDYYYLSTHETITGFKETIDSVYRKCYQTCKTCLGEGDDNNNNCGTCKDDLINYNFDKRQCMIDYNKICFENKKYWEFENNNITCKEENYCKNKKIILYGPNKGQCVDNCLDFKDPNALNQYFYTLLNCDGKSYCIPSDKCLTKKFDHVNHQEKTCERKAGYECQNINFFDDSDPFSHDNDPEGTSEPLSPDEKKDDIAKRIKVVKILTEETNYLNFNRTDTTLMEEYKALLSKESENYEEKEIYLIILKKYKNFNIVIYPLDIETFAYDNVLVPNNIGSINFENYFLEYINYEIFNNQIILVILLESFSQNSAINELNYYFYGLKEEDLSQSEFLNDDSKTIMKGNNNNNLKLMYPLKNYYNKDSTLKKRNSEYLVENIKSFNSEYPEVELYNIEDPFFNDICFQFKSEIEADMTLDDRRQEYYINKSLCEDNCYIEKLIIKDNTVKSVCSCNLKEIFSFNKNAGIKDDIPSISKINAKSILCIDKAFKPQNVAKNPIFWVLVIFIIFLIIMLLAFIFYGNGVLKRILNINSSENSQVPSEENSEIYKNSNNIDNKKIIKNNKNDDNISDIKDLQKKESFASSKSNEINKLIINNNKNSKINNNSNNNNNENNNIKNMSKNSSIYDYNSNNNKKDLINKDESISMDSVSSKNNKPNPPKKGLKKAESITTKAGGEDKDILSNDPSFLKNYQSSEISYESYKGEKPILIDNLLENGVEMENNYINYPKEFEKKIIFNLIRNSIFSNEENDEEENDKEKQRYNSDIYECNYDPEIKDDFKKKLRSKNNKITKLLDGEDIINDKNLKKGYGSDNYNEKKYKKGKGGSKINESDEDEYSPHFTKNILFSYNISTQKNNKNTKKEYNGKNKESNKKDNNFNNLINESTSKSNEKKEPNLIMNNNKSKNEKVESGNKKRSRRLKISNIKENPDDKSREYYGKDDLDSREKMRTEADNDDKERVKETLKDIINDGNSSKEEYGSSSSQIMNKSYQNEKGMIEDVAKNKLKSGKKGGFKKFNFIEEKAKNGDIALPYNKKNSKNAKKNKKNKNNVIEINMSNEGEKREDNIEKKSDFEIFNEKVLGSSVSSFAGSNTNKQQIPKEVPFFPFYWRYLRTRELILVSFIDTKDEIPYFVRWSCFVFCLFFLFMLNCLFLFESAVHDKFVYKLNGGKNDTKYYFENDFVMSIYVALIYIVFKMIIIRLLLNRVLKVKKDDKKIMQHSYEKELTEGQLENLKDKRVNYLMNYHKKLIIYFSVMLALTILFAYICVCYSEIFKKSVPTILLGFVFSIIFSFIFCAVICFIIVSLYKLGKKFKNKCLLSIYLVLHTIY